MQINTRLKFVKIYAIIYQWATLISLRVKTFSFVECLFTYLGCDRQKITTKTTQLIVTTSIVCTTRAITIIKTIYNTFHEHFPCHWRKWNFSLYLFAAARYFKKIIWVSMNLIVCVLQLLKRMQHSRALSNSEHYFLETLQDLTIAIKTFTHLVLSDVHNSEVFNTYDKNLKWKLLCNILSLITRGDTIL